jgi:hypothetical protein
MQRVPILRAFCERWGFAWQSSCLHAPRVASTSAPYSALAVKCDVPQPPGKVYLTPVATIPGVESVGLTDALLLNDSGRSNIFPDRTTDLAIECRR